MRSVVCLGALALVLAAVVGCGDGGTGDASSVHINPSVTVPLCYAIDGTPAPGCPTATPRPAYSPAKATIGGFCISRTPGGPCPTWTPVPTATTDSELHLGCPVTPGETAIIDGTPVVILARACTPTATPAN
jgi:hypothetical protein